MGRWGFEECSGCLSSIHLASEGERDELGAAYANSFGKPIAFDEQPALDHHAGAGFDHPVSRLRSLYLPHTVLSCDLLVSMPKMKTHHWAIATLSMKNLFGITPNALYGDEAGSEDGTAGRGVLHTPGPKSGSESGRRQRRWIER